MDLAPPPLDPAAPGKPITAQAWNAIKDAILALYEAFNGLDQGSLVTVDVKEGSAVFATAMVVARKGDDRVLGVPPIGNQQGYVLRGLTAGEWSLSVVADGYAKVETTFTLPGAASIPISMQRDDSPAMPDLFGLIGKDALVALDARKIGIDRIFDTTGKELTASQVRKATEGMVVLYQQPKAGSFVAVKSERARLVLGTTIQTKTVITVPDVEGLTLERAKALLAEQGLTLENVTFIEDS